MGTGNKLLLTREMNISRCQLVEVELTFGHCAVISEFDPKPSSNCVACLSAELIGSSPVRLRLVTEQASIEKQFAVSPLCFSTEGDPPRE
jgi:hypothetical protein